MRRALERLAREIDRARRRPQAAPPPAASTPRTTPTTPQPTRGPSRAVATVPPPGTVFRDIDAPWCPELVVIPPGEFLMGSSADDAQAHDDEKPQHRVRIAYPLAVGRYPITFREYDHFCEQTRYQLPDDIGWGRGLRPVINVSWDDAKAYVEWLAALTGQPYRLLSEAEWEYACRAGTTTRYWWGDGISEDNANYDSRATTEVGSYPVSPFGLFDLHGNVWEWVEDRWHDTYEGAPEDGTPWLQGGESRRVMRGGCWCVDPGPLRAACRSRDNSGGRVVICGFRVARTFTS